MGGDVSQLPILFVNVGLGGGGEGRGVNEVTRHDVSLNQHLIVTNRMDLRRR